MRQFQGPGNHGQKLSIRKWTQGLDPCVFAIRFVEWKSRHFFGGAGNLSGGKCSSHPSKIAHNKKVPGKETSTERVGALRMMRCLQDIFLLPKSDFHQGMMKV